MSGTRDPAHIAAYNRKLRARHRAEAAAAADEPAAQLDVRAQLARWDDWFNLNAATGPSAIDRSEP